MTDDDEVREAKLDVPPEIAFLVAALHKPIADFYRSGPPSHERAYDVMSALAIVAATIIIGTEADMYKWFGDAVFEAVNKLAAQIKEQDDAEPKGTVQ